MKWTIWADSEGEWVRLPGKASTDSLESNCFSKQCTVYQNTHLGFLDFKGLNCCLSCFIHCISAWSDDGSAPSKAISPLGSNYFATEACTALCQDASFPTYPRWNILDLPNVAITNSKWVSAGKNTTVTHCIPNHGTVTKRNTTLATTWQHEDKQNTATIPLFLSEMIAHKDLHTCNKTRTCPHKRWEQH